MIKSVDINQRFFHPSIHQAESLRSTLHQRFNTVSHRIIYVAFIGTQLFCHKLIKMNDYLRNRIKIQLLADMIIGRGTNKDFY